LFWYNLNNRITDPKLRGADCKSAPAALDMIDEYPEELGVQIEKQFFTGSSSENSHPEERKNVIIAHYKKTPCKH
jgi:hypothetical protein